MSPEPGPLRSSLKQSPPVKFGKWMWCIWNAGKHNCALKSLITSHHTSMCRDPRDRVYGLLGLAPEGTGLTPDYLKPATELFFDVLRVCIWKSYVDHYLVHFSELLQKY